MATSSAKMNSCKVNSVSSLRIKPFTKLAKGVAAPRQSRVVRSAEVDAEVPMEAAPAVAAEQDTEFEFSISDARKNNEYAASDVDAAMRFYSEGAAEPVHNADFITNQYGEEDASFFDDIDNNEAYDADEYNIAGIPEAAPKKRRGGRRGEGEEVDEDDQIAKGKELDRFKALEDQMVMEAAMEEEYGSDYERSGEGVQMVASQGVWDWLTDADASPEAGDELARSKLATVRRSRIEMPSDNEVLSGFSTLKLEELDEQTRDMLELIINDDVTEDELKTLDFNAIDENDDVPESDVLTQDDTARMDDLAAQPLDALEVEIVPLPVQLVSRCMHA